MGSRRSQPLARSLGQFLGHIVKAVRTDPNRRVLRREQQQERRGDVVLRRTTIDEVELKDAGPATDHDT